MNVEYLNLLLEKYMQYDREFGEVSQLDLIREIIKRLNMLSKNTIVRRQRKGKYPRNKG